MQRLFYVLLVCCALMMSLGAHAEDVTVPPYGHRVTDLTNTLSAEQQSALESKLAAFEQAKGSQIALLIVPTTQPEDIAQYSIRVVDAWKVGREKQDDGVLLLIAKNDRKMRIEVGRGLEGAIPDVYAKRIIAEHIAPLFKQGDIYGGLNAGLDKIMALIDGEKLPAPAHQRQKGGDNNYFVLLMAAIFGGSILSSMFGRFFGSTLTGGLVGGMAWLLLGTVMMSAVLGLAAFLLALAFSGSQGGRGYGSDNSFGGWGGGFGGGGFGGGSGGFGGGGGGSFGGGGASGDW